MVLASNTGARGLLAKHKGRNFKLMLPGFSIAAVCDIDGYLLEHNLNDYDVLIGIPLHSASFLIDQDKLSVYKKLSFSGDTTFAYELLEIFSKLHLDGIYTKLDSPVMLFALHKLTNLSRAITNYLQPLVANTNNTVKEYLLYETQDLVTRFENDQFCSDVDTLRSRSDRLEQQLLDKTNRAILQ